MHKPAWKKSSYSGSQANCVEVTVRDRIMVRDTKDRTGRVLRFTPASGATSPNNSREQAQFQ